MFGGSIKPAQSRKVQLARITCDWNRIGALITGVTDEARCVLSGGMFMNRSRKGREQ